MKGWVSIMSDVLAAFKSSVYFPPGGAYFYTVPETGRYFESRQSMQDLLNKVQAHLEVNGLPVPSDQSHLRRLIEDHICRRVPVGFCTERAGIPGMDFFSVQKATELLVRRATQPDFFVGAMEADRRAGICKDCTYNVRTMCTSCNGLKKLFGRLVSNRKTRYDDQLGVCAKCGCGLQAKVQVNRKYLDKEGESVDNLPEFCWLKGPAHV